MGGYWGGGTILNFGAFGMPGSESTESSKKKKSPKSRYRKWHKPKKPKKATLQKQKPLTKQQKKRQEAEKRALWEQARAEANANNVAVLLKKAEGEPAAVSGDGGNRTGTEPRIKTTCCKISK